MSIRWRWGLVLVFCVAGGCKSEGPGEAPPDPEADLAVTPEDAATPAAPDAAVVPTKDAAAGTLVEGKWVSVKAGAYTMGSPSSELCRDEDEAAHPVTLTRGFAIAETEVTQKQWASLMGYQPSFHSPGCDECPVEWVSWHEAAAYCNAVSAAKKRASCYDCAGKAAAVSCTPKPGAPAACKGYRLPTEAEWEYAARAGSTTALANGEISSCMTTDANADKIAWYKVSSEGLTHPVAKKAPNAWGLFDMAGNVYEWVHDWYAADLGSAALSDPGGPATGKERVFRGGGFYFNAEHARSANRDRFDPARRFTFVGFRCVVSE